MKKMLTIISLLLISINILGQEKVKGELIFPLQGQHVHGSSIIELPNGDMLACWFQGSGERSANDVAIKGARLKKGEDQWSDVFIMADTPGQPDCNPVLFFNKENKLFLSWVVVQANRWETSLLKYRTSIDYENVGAPNWNWQDIILLKPTDDFAKEIKTKFKNNPGPEMGWSEYAPLQR